MWAIVKSPQRRGRDSGHSARRNCGFSHPAGFEQLEERVTLNGAPGALDGGPGTMGAETASPATLLGISSAGMPLPGSASPTSGTNPADLALVNSTGMADPTADAVRLSELPAFNNPSWLPNDRPMNAATTPPGDHLPLNVNQVASTPFGIRNFSFGPNTGSHFELPASGRPVLIGRGVGPTVTAMIEPLSSPVAEQLSSAKLRGNSASLPTQDHLENGSSTDLPDVETASHEVADDVPPAPVLTAEAKTLSVLNETAIDQAMADQPAIVPEIAGIDAEDTPEDSAGTGNSLHALAASLAMAAAVVPAVHQMSPTVNPSGKGSSSSST